MTKMTVENSLKLALLDSRSPKGVHTNGMYSASRVAKFDKKAVKRGLVKLRGSPDVEYVDGRYKFADGVRAALRKQFADVL